MPASSIKAAALIMLALLVNTAEARSNAARYQFRKLHPCPATQSRHGPCPGYVIDHVTPLCAGGPDHPNNMRWQPADEAKQKDRQERESCRQTTR